MTERSTDDAGSVSGPAGAGAGAAVVVIVVIVIVVLLIRRRRYIVINKSSEVVNYELQTEVLSV